MKTRVKENIRRMFNIQGMFGIAVLAAAMVFVMTACPDPGGDDPIPKVPVISITVQPTADTTVTEGSISGSLSVTATITEDAVLGYQWYKGTSASNKGGTAIDSATKASFVIPTTLTEGAYYYFCEVTGSGDAASVRSAVAKVTVKAPDMQPVPVITITAQPAAETAVMDGDTETLSVTATVTQDAALSYQWYINWTASYEGSIAIDGATKASFAIPNITVGVYYFFCEITASGGAAAVRSDAAKVTVSPCPAISISGQPVASTTVTVGNITGSLFITAAGVNGAEVTGYKWYGNSIAIYEGATPAEGTTATTSDFTIPANLTVGVYYYFCEITASGVELPKRTDFATVTVKNPDVDIDIYFPGSRPPGPIIQQGGEGVWPNFEAKANENTVFMVMEDYHSDYQWYMDGVAEPGEISESYTFNKAAGVYILTVVVTTEEGERYSSRCRVTVKEGV